MSGILKTSAVIALHPLALACSQLVRLILRGYYSLFYHVWANFGPFLSLVFRTREISRVVVLWASLGFVDSWNFRVVPVGFSLGLPD